MDDNIKHVIKIGIRANSAESGPPLGTVLGNIGVNAIKFAKDFNEYTVELPNFYKVNVIIYIFRNNSYKFIVKFPSIGALLSYCGKKIIMEDIFFIFQIF
jgi:ribosomal protein L11